MNDQRPARIQEKHPRAATKESRPSRWDKPPLSTVPSHAPFILLVSAASDNIYYVQMSIEIFTVGKILVRLCKSPDSCYLKVMTRRIGRVVSGITQCDLVRDLSGSFSWVFALERECVTVWFSPAALSRFFVLRSERTVATKMNWEKGDGTYHERECFINCTRCRP